MKKIFAILMAMIMMLSMVAMATTGNSTDNQGTIEISNANIGETYKVYQMFELVSFNTETGNYSYDVTDDWAAFFAAGGEGAAYITLDEDGYISSSDNLTTATVAAFAAKAKAYAATKTATASKVADAETVKFEGLELGYYLIDTTLGTLCSIDNTDLKAEVQDKNVEPTLKKEVKEDSTGVYGAANTAQIGDTVEFKITVAAKEGARNYVVHDKADAGLTVDTTSIAVEGLTKGTQYTVVTTDICADCDFHVVFAQDYLDTITANTDIVITYSATLNEDAVISTDTNDNVAWLTYGNVSETDKTTNATTTTETLKFQLVKIDVNDKVLDGAQFKLFDAVTGGNEIAVVKMENGEYRIAVAGETGVAIDAGIAVINGLDANTSYYLEETQAPVGYNALTARVEVPMAAANLMAQLSEDSTGYVSGGIAVENLTGTALPSTGGIGTTIFYVVGGMMMAAAIVLLVTKKKVAASK